MQAGDLLCLALVAVPSPKGCCGQPSIPSLPFLRPSTTTSMTPVSPLSSCSFALICERIIARRQADSASSRRMGRE